MDAGDDDGATPLYVSGAFGSHGAAALLLEAGAADDAVSVCGYIPMWDAFNHGHAECVRELIAHTERAARLYNRCFTMMRAPSEPGEQKTVYDAADEYRTVYEVGMPWLTDNVSSEKIEQVTQQAEDFEQCLRHILERQLAVRAEDSDDDDDTERTYAFPPPVDLDAYAEACRLPPAEETEDEREARFQRERCFGL